MLRVSEGQRDILRCSALGAGTSPEGVDGPLAVFYTCAMTQDNIDTLKWYPPVLSNMVHRKEEYEANGHKVTIQQVNEDGDVSAWIDGRAAYIDSAMNSLISDSETADIPVSDKVEYHLENGETWGAIRATLAYMTDCHVYYCNKCNRFYDYNNATNYGFADHKCGKCANEDAHCPDNPNGDDHEDECRNPHQRHNARVPTKFRCKHCGRLRQTTPTG